MSIPTQQEAALIFAPLRAVLTEREYPIAEVFSMVAQFAQSNPTLGVAFASEIARSMEEFPTRLNNEHVADAYFGTLFDNRIATKYGTNFFSHSADAMQQYVDDFTKESDGYPGAMARTQAPAPSLKQ